MDMVIGWTKTLSLQRRRLQKSLTKRWKMVEFWPVDGVSVCYVLFVG